MNGKTVLVVDDSRSARFAMRRFLEALGCRVQTADSGADALAAIRSQPPDLVFLDHLMPQMDGLAVLDRLRQDPLTTSLPVVLCSSDDSAGFLRQARLRGAMDVMVKPPSTRQIETMMERLRQLPKTVIAEPVLAVWAMEAAQAPVPSRVQTIRDPEVTIEQAVMKTLRDALPGAATATSPASPTLSDPIRLASPSPQPAVPVDPPAKRRDTQLRTEIESRLRHIAQDLFAQLGEVRAQVAHLDAAVVTAQQSDDDRIGAMEGALGERLDRLGAQFGEQLAQLREELLTRIEAQNQRIERIAREAHAAAVDEAHAVSERVVMNAAQRISDQIAESILKVLQPPAAHRAG